MYARALLLASADEALAPGDFGPVGIDVHSSVNAVQSQIVRILRGGGAPAAVVRCLLGTVDWSDQCSPSLACGLMGRQLCETMSASALGLTEMWAVLHEWLEPRGRWHTQQCGQGEVIDPQVERWVELDGLSARPVDALASVAVQFVCRTAFDDRTRRGLPELLPPTLAFLFDVWEPSRVARELFLDVGFNLHHCERRTLCRFLESIPSRRLMRGVCESLSGVVAAELWSNRLHARERCTFRDLNAWESVAGGCSMLWCRVLSDLLERIETDGDVDLATVDFAGFLLRWLVNLSIDEARLHGSIEQQFVGGAEWLVETLLRLGSLPSASIEGRLGLAREGSIGGLVLKSLLRRPRWSVPGLADLLALEVRPC